VELLFNSIPIHVLEMSTATTGICHPSTSHAVDSNAVISTSGGKKALRRRPAFTQGGLR